MKKRFLSLLSVMALLCTLVAGMTFGSVSAEEVVMKPGMTDWVEPGEAYAGPLTVPETSGLRYTAANGTLGHIAVNATAGPHTTYVQDTAGQQMGDMQNTTFFGKKLTGAVGTDACWSGAYIQYKVQGGIYAATALPLHHWSSHWGDTADVYAFWTSADGVTWQKQTATTYKESSYGAISVYRAVVKIPDDANYYRVILPGANSTDPEVPAYHYQDSPDWPTYFANFIGPSVFSAYDLTQYSALGEIPEFQTATAVLDPGEADWLTASAEQNMIGDAYYSAYGTFGMISATDLANGTQNWQRIYAVNSVHDQYYNITLTNRGKENEAPATFMGKNVTGYCQSSASWVGAYLQYRVQGGSYIATALHVHESQTNDLGTGLENSFVFQTSADGSTWNTATANIIHVGYGTSYWTYKAVVQIPENSSYYRIIMPGAQSLDPSTTYYDGSMPYWHAFLGASVASAYDLSKCDTLSDIPDFAEYVQTKNLGGQVREGGTNALRFGFKLDAENVVYEDADHADNNYNRALSAESKIYVDNKAYTVTDFGALLSGYESAELNDVDAEDALKVPAAKLYEVRDNGDVVYTVVVTNIADDKLGTQIYARPYVEYVDNGVTKYLYGEKIARSWNDCNPDEYTK